MYAFAPMAMIIFINRWQLCFLVRAFFHFAFGFLFSSMYKRKFDLTTKQWVYTIHFHIFYPKFIISFVSHSGLGLYFEWNGVVPFWTKSSSILSVKYEQFLFCNRNVFFIPIESNVKYSINLIELSNSPVRSRANWMEHWSVFSWTFDPMFWSKLNRFLNSPRQSVYLGNYRSSVSSRRTIRLRSYVIIVIVSLLESSQKFEITKTVKWCLLFVSKLEFKFECRVCVLNFVQL